MQYLHAFLCGGVLCAIGQLLIDKTQLTPARILTGYVVAGVLLQAVGVYQYAVDWGRRRGDGAADGLRLLSGKGRGQGSGGEGAFGRSYRRTYGHGRRHCGGGSLRRADGRSI